MKTVIKLAVLALIVIVVRRITRPLRDDYYPMRCDAGKVG